MKEGRGASCAQCMLPPQLLLHKLWPACRMHTHTCHMACRLLLSLSTLFEASWSCPSGRALFKLHPDVASPCCPLSPCVYLYLLSLPQEFQPSGAHGKSVKMGDYVRDLLLEQVCIV